MSLPDSRNTDYTPTTKVKSADLNDMQDSVVAAAHGPIVDTLHPFAAALGSNTSKHAAGYVAFSAAGDCSIAPKMTTGDRVTSVLLRVFGNAATEFAVNVWVMSASNVLANINPGFTGATLTPAAAWTDLAIDVTDTTLGAGETLLITIETDGGGVRLGNVSIFSKHPL